MSVIDEADSGQATTRDDPGLGDDMSETDSLFDGTGDCQPEPKPDPAHVKNALTIISGQNGAVDDLEMDEQDFDTQSEFDDTEDSESNPKPDTAFDKNTIMIFDGQAATKDDVAPDDQTTPLPAGTDDHQDRLKRDAIHALTTLEIVKRVRSPPAASLSDTESSTEDVLDDQDEEMVAFDESSTPVTNFSAPNDTVLGEDLEESKMIPPDQTYYEDCADDFDNGFQIDEDFSNAVYGTNEMDFNGYNSDGRQVDDGKSLFIPDNTMVLHPEPRSSKTGNIPAPSVMGALAFDKIVQLQHNLTRRAKKPNTPNLGSLLQTKAKLDQHPHPTSKLRSLLQGSPAHNAHNAAQCTEEDENEDRRAAARFQQQERHYDDLKRRNGGRLSFAQSIEWDTIQMAERLRVKKRERELALERLDETEASQTLPGMDDAPEDEEQNAMHSDTEEEEIIEARKRKKIAMPRKEVKHQSLQEAEARSLEVALEGAGYGKKRKTGEGTAKARSTTKSRKSKPKPKSKEVKTAQPKKQRKSAKQKEEEARQLNQSTSLFTSDVFADQAPEDAAEQPVFTSTTKSEALAQLLSSVSMGCKNAAGADKRALLAATKDFDGRGSVKADGKGLWLVKGMKTSLKPYQVLGAAFMRRRENALEEPRGGLMADQMGLGKTLMTLANIVNGRSTDPDVKTTLLVASPSLLTQWHREIDQHTDRKWNIMRYGTGSRIDSNFNVKVFEHCDIILTTYHEVVRSYPKNKPPVELQTAEEKIAWWKKEFATKRGMLHRIQFYRIVLDEAQAIKNHTSRTSIACRALMARHRWALSGTPIVNGLEELYPYFKFLNVPYTGSLKIFKNNYCDSKNPENADRLLLKLNQFMIRRTHADTMFGAPILKLPKADQITLWCDFNPVERNIYEIVQKRFIERINSWSREGEIHKSYNNILVMLLRLRQLTAHVWMLELVMKDLLEQEDIEKIRDVVKHADFNEKTGHTIMAIRKQLEWYAKTGRKPGPREVAVTASSQDTNESQSHSNEGSGGNFGKDYDFKPYLDSLTSGESGQKREAKARCCAGYEGCTKGPKNLWLTACGHLYCEVCYLEAMLSAGEEEGNQCVTCMKCGSIWKSARPCDVEDDQEERFSVPTTGNGRQRVRADKEELKNDWISMCGPKLLPSTKTVAVKAQILNWIDENPNVKIIIYTWFLPMMRILSKVFEQEGWPTEQYHGKMSHEARDKALRHFADNDKIRVMLASIQCGGLGLNLTMASRVIIIDPWWNRAVEQQAFCRVFRIGQKETTFMTRFCVRNTVDERLIQMQDRKQKEIDEIMEDDGTRLKKLKMADLLRLFGAVVDGEGGKPFIMVDNAGTHGGFHADEDHEGYADEE